VRVAKLTVWNFRNYERAAVVIPHGLTIVHGPVGAGKTNLLEAIYVGCVGRSCWTANDRDLVKFGELEARVGVTSSNGAVERHHEVLLAPGRSKTFRVDGARCDGPPALDRPLVCVFMPDRLELVKGPAGVRRAHLDSLVAALWPTRGATRAEYSRALAQRNALLLRVRRGRASLDSLAGWNRELSHHAVQLREDRAAAVELVSGGFASRARQLGFERAALVRYRPRSRAATPDQFEAELVAALERDLERGFTTYGPHRDDLSFEVGERDVRRFGSQGQQRLALLALLLAERDALRDARESTPILLLDDVLSELDRERRHFLLEAVRDEGQTLITTADPGALTIDDQVPSMRIANGRLDA
jgi:DNA replication and repair protein RecF